MKKIIVALTQTRVTIVHQQRHAQLLGRQVVNTARPVRYICQHHRLHRLHRVLAATAVPCSVEGGKGAELDDDI